MKTRLLAVLLLRGSSLFAETHFSIGVGIGVPGYYPPPPPPVVVYERPPCPDPGDTWVDGYWYPVGPRYYWHAGYWARPPYARGYWVAPRYEEHRYYSGYWERGERHWNREDGDDRWEHHERHRDRDRDDDWDDDWHHGHGHGHGHHD